jgi:hypothetical protein
MTATGAHTSPVRFEPCEALRLVGESAIPVCDVCGWLEDDHAPPTTGGAVVTELPRRVAWRQERKAS